MPGLHGNERRLGRGRPDPQVVKAGKLQLDAVVAPLAHEGHPALGHVVEDERGVAVDEPMCERELAGVLHETGHAAEVVQAPLVDDGHLGVPPLGEDEGIVIKALALGPWHGHVEGRVAAQRERQVDVSRVGDGEGLRERGAVNGVGHVEAEVIGIELAGGLARAQLIGHRVGGDLLDLVLVGAG